MTRNLILTGGIVHPFDRAAPALAVMLDRHGIRSTVSEDIEAGLAAVARGEFDLLTIYALRWTMSQHEKYAADRPRWGFSLSPQGRAAIVGHLARGGGLFGVHTASLCFDDWPQWGEVLGGAWVWGKSGHPPYGAARVRLDDRTHVLLRGLEDFELRDEVYGDLALAGDVAPLARASADGITWQPVLWTRRVGAGRVVYDALGHDADALAHPVHARIVARAAMLAAGRSESEVEKA